MPLLATVLIGLVGWSLEFGTGLGGFRVDLGVVSEILSEVRLMMPVGRSLQYYCHL